jgi:hypothetical protein
VHSTIAVRRQIALAGTVLVGLLLAAAVAIVWVQVVSTLAKPKAVTGPLGQPQALGWGSHVFSTPAQLRAWLAVRHVSYASWAKNHPAALAQLEHRPVPTQPAAATEASPKPKRPAAPTETTTAVAATGGGSGTHTWVVVMLGVLAIVIGVLAVVPRAIPARLPQESWVSASRGYAAASAIAILVGLFIPLLLR